MGRTQNNINAQICLEDVLAILLDIQFCNEIIECQALHSGSFDVIHEEALIQRERIRRLKRELSRTWAKIVQVE